MAAVITASRLRQRTVALTEWAPLMDAGLHLSLWMWASLGWRTYVRAHTLCPASAAKPALGRTGPRRHWAALCMLRPRRLRLLVCISQPRSPWSVLQILHSAYAMPGRHGNAEGASPRCVLHGADGVCIRISPWRRSTWRKRTIAMQPNRSRSGHEQKMSASQAAWTPVNPAAAGSIAMRR